MRQMKAACALSFAAHSCRNIREVGRERVDTQETCAAHVASTGAVEVPSEHTQRDNILIDARASDLTAFFKPLSPFLEGLELLRAVCLVRAMLLASS